MARLLPACLLLLLALAAIALVAPTARAEPVERETANGVVFEDVVDATDNGDLAEEDTAALSISSKSSHAKTSDDDDDTKDSDEDSEDSDKYEETTRVLQLGSDSFLDLLDSASNIAVVFLEGTSGCHSCALSIQLFEELAEDAKWEKIEFAVFDCQKDSSICSRYSVEQYPTIKLFNEGMGVYDYAQPVLSTALLDEFLTVYTGPKFTDITTTEELSRLSEHFISVVYFRKEDDSKLSGTFERTAAELFERLTFFRVAVAAQTAELLQDYNVTAGDFILVRNPPAKFSARLISHFEEPTISRSKLRDWVKSNFALPVMNFAVTEFSSAAALGLPLVVAHVSYADQELVDNTLSLLWQLQAKFPQRFVFGIIDITREDPLSLQRLGLYDTSKPAFLVHSMRGSHKFTGDVASFAALEAWVTAYSQGRLLRQPIRQPVPKTPEFTNGVQTLVHDNFRSIVFDEEKDAVVFFYLPESSCEPCKMLLPIYEQVAQEFAKWSESIVFGKINMYLNEASPGVHVSNFPTIKYFAADLKNKEFTFSGPRTLENMRQFILNSSSFELQTDDAPAAAAAEAPQGGVNSPDIV